MAARRAVFMKDGVTRIFDIRGSHDNEENRRYLVLDAEEGMSNG